jgi:hypothetical protein
MSVSELLPVRSFQRGRTVGVGLRDLSVNKTSYVNIARGDVRRDINRHSAVGAVLPVGTVVRSIEAGTIAAGGQVDEGPVSTDLILRVAAGSLKTDAGAIVPIVAGTVTVAAADATNIRVDRVVVDATTGVASIVTGVPTAGSPAGIPAPGANKITLAFIWVDPAVTGIANAFINDARS